MHLFRRIAGGGDDGGASPTGPGVTWSDVDAAQAARTEALIAGLKRRHGRRLAMVGLVQKKRDVMRHWMPRVLALTEDRLDYFLPDAPEAGPKGGMHVRR